MSRTIAAASMVAAMLWALLGVAGGETSAAQDPGQKNLFVNSELKAEDGGLPTGWQAGALPPCGASFVTHKAAKSDSEPGEIEISNDSPAESSFAQPLTLKPGWYQFTAEVNIETLGSAGESPELFAKSLRLPVSTRSHPMGFRTGWRKYQLSFRTGPSVSEVSVGCALGAWGNPNTGRILMRNPVLMAIEPLHAQEEFEDLEKYDLQKIADSRFVSPEAKEAFSPPKYPHGRPWTVAAVYGAFAIIAILGWRRVSPRRRLCIGGSGNRQRHTFALKFESNQIVLRQIVANLPSL